MRRAKGRGDLIGLVHLRLSCLRALPALALRYHLIVLWGI